MISEMKIRTPEGVEFSIPLAGPVVRCMAVIIDILCVMVVISVATQLMKMTEVISPDISLALLVLVQFAAQMAYGIACEWLWRGQTVGKRLFKLRVVDEQGLRLEFPQIVIRNLLRWVDALPLFYAVGGAVCFFSKRCQRLGDIAANTVVVQIRTLSEPDFDQLALSKFNSLRGHGHLVARLRQKVSPRLARIALDALLRRDAFNPDARLALFAELAAHFKEIVAFPPDAVEMLTDEQYLRNIVDILFRTTK